MLFKYPHAVVLALSLTALPEAARLCGAKDEPMTGSFDGSELRINSSLRANTNTERLAARLLCAPVIESRFRQTAFLDDAERERASRALSEDAAASQKRPAG